MNLKTHITKIIWFALDRGGGEIRMTFLHEKVNTNQQHKHSVIWFKSLMLQGEVTWSSCVLIRLPFWQNYEDYGITLRLFICLLIARPAELDGKSPTVCLRLNTHPENGLKSTSDAKRSLSLQLQNSKVWFHNLRKALQSLHQNEQCRHIKKQRWNDDRNTTFMLSNAELLNCWLAVHGRRLREFVCQYQTVTVSSQLLTFCRRVYHAFFGVFIVTQPPQLNSFHYLVWHLTQPVHVSQSRQPSEEQQHCCFSFHAEATVTITSV